MGCRAGYDDGMAGRDSELIQIVDAAMADAVRRSGQWLVCKPGCWDCCRGEFQIHALDADRLRRGLDAIGLERAAAIRQRASAVSGDDSTCPVLDPATGLCDLYEWRPMTCRVFGPPIGQEDGSLGVCDLCYHGATEDEIAACEATPDPQQIEERLLAEYAAWEGTVAEAVLKQ